MRNAKVARQELDNKPRNSPQMLTMNKLSSEYFDSIRGAVRAHSAANYKDLLDRYFLPEFGPLKVDLVDEPKLTRLLLRLRDNGMKPGSVNTVRARIVALLEYAVKRGLIANNPGKMTRKHKISSPDETAVQPALSLPEARQLLVNAKETELDVFIALCLGLGLRKGEALGLKWSDVDLEAGTVFIQRSRGQQRRTNSLGKVVSTECDGELKTNSSRRLLHLNNVVLEALFRYRTKGDGDDQGYLVTRGNGSPYPISRLTRQYRALCQDAQVRYTRIHDLRHTSATLALEGAAPIESVSQALGHSGIDVTKRIYAPVVSHLNQVFADTLGSELSGPIVATISNEGVAHVG